MIEEALRRLEKLGVNRAPIQHFTDTGAIHGRYVTLRDPAGVYYLLGTAPQTKDKIQLLFLGVPEMADHFAEQIGWSVESKELLPGSTDKVQVHSAILEPPFTRKTTLH